MCSKPKPTPEPAAAPAPPLPAPDAPAVGQSRRQESRENWGEDAPNYRVKRPTKKTPAAPSAPIQM